jgi:DinB family protein
MVGTVVAFALRRRSTSCVKAGEARPAKKRPKSPVAYNEDVPADHPPDIVALVDAYDAAERDARALVADLPADLGVWRAHPGSWSVAQCLDHLATGNRVYIDAMRPAAERALAEGRTRRSEARPGLVGGWFVRYLEPPVNPRLKGKSPRNAVPRPSPALADAASQFFASQDLIRAFIDQYAGIDLTRVRFPNPFIRGVRFSLATGLHVLAAHERRHLWQGWRVRREAENQILRATASPSRPMSARSL